MSGLEFLENLKILPPGLEFLENLKFLPPGGRVVCREPDGVGVEFVLTLPASAAPGKSTGRRDIGLSSFGKYDA